MNTQDETIFVNYREPVACFGSNPSADIKLIKKLNEEHPSKGGHMLSMALFVGLPLLIATIAIVKFIASL